MLLLDIGNSRIKGSFCNGKSLSESFNYQISELEELFVLIRKHPHLKKIFICSVSDKTLSELLRFLKNRPLSVLCVKKDFSPLIRSRYDLSQLGSDRMMNIYACNRLYSVPVFLISAGTAFTADFIDGNGIHQGGMIMPGISSGSAWLHAAAPSLPLITPEFCEFSWPADTVSALNCGSVYLYQFFTQKLLSLLPADTVTVITGGDYKKLQLENSRIHPELVLQGLMFSSYE